MGTQSFGKREFSGRWDPFVVFVLTLAGFAFGIWAHWPMLEVEFQRLPVWQILLVSVADVAGIMLFLRGILRCAQETEASVSEAPVSAETHYLEVHYNLRRATDAENPNYQKKVLRAMLLSFAIPWGIDLAASLALREVEHDEFEHAAVTTGQVVRIEKWQASRGVCRFRYHLHCRFHDDAGNTHETIQILCTDNHGAFPDGLASDVRDALRNRQLPAPIRMAYCVDAPSQTWLADLGPGHGFDLHGFSVQLLFGQCFFMVILIFGPLMTSAERGNAVDWRKGAASIPLSLKEAAPMVIETTWLAFCGFMELTLFQRII